MHNTAIMVGASARTGDKVAVLWSTDILLRWYETCRLNWGSLAPRHDWALDTTLITTGLLSSAWSEVAALPLTIFEGQNANPRDVFDVAAENAWRDIQFVLVGILIRWASELGSGGAAVLAVRMILRHEPYDADAITGRTGPFSADDALGSILRLVASGDRFGKSYVASISGVVSTLNDLTREPWVSQRIYSSTGLHDVYELAREQVITLIALGPDAAPLPVRLSAGLAGALRRASERDDEAARRLQDHLGSLRTAIDAFDHGRDGPLLVALRGAPDDTGFDRWCTATRSLIDACLETLSAVRDERIRTAVIDPARLQKIAVAASKTGFTKDSAAFPISLFQEIERTPEPLQAWTLRMKHGRADLTSPLMAYPVSNEASWWAETIRQYVAALVVGDVFTSGRIEEVRADTPEAWWEAVKVAALPIEQGGGKPMLLIASVVEPIWLSDWTWNIPQPDRPARPVDLRIWRSDEERAPSYEFHLNGIAVFHAPIEKEGCTYVLPAALLRRVEFRDYPPGQPVLVEFEDDPADPWNGILKATLARRVTLGDGKIVRIRHSDEPDAEPAVAPAPSR